ncbi:helix-turn-helix transcriptional regulator [Leptospira stimsonii]|uniref:XRE family transcriptional regulator n=1 Tax=Leptospira stimsonii TaxID=2202203 RepID=A0A396YW47_9LEPT|nr:helix-turn-helix transcriptional regulator [Leptospira stimsonii]RHX85557.1 XRE family transcriptional regulator [Leptospira stimsonii]
MSNTFGNTLKTVRNAKKKSQLDLALDADISTKHLSFLESGRALPGREIVKKLTDALEISYPFQSILFLAAGFSPDFEIVEDEQSNSVFDSLLLKQIDAVTTSPTMVVNWENVVIKINPVLEKLIATLKGDEFSTEGLSAYDFMFSDKGLGPYLLENPELRDRIITCSHLENFVNQIDRSSNIPDPDPKSDQLNKSGFVPVTICIKYKGILMFDVLPTSSGHPYEVNVRSTRIYTWVPSNRFTEDRMKDLLSADSDISELVAY